MTEQEYQSSVKAVWSATIILSIITVVEVIVALTVGHLLPKFVLNTFYAIASVAKAFFIVGEFMHLKYEKRALMISLRAPLVFLLWALIALVTEGHFWNIVNHPK